MRLAVEGAEAAAGVDDAAPLVGEAQLGELGERHGEVFGQLDEGLVALLVLRLDLAAVVVDRVVATPENAVVVGQPVVVELVGRVADALPVVPADGGQLLGGERLGHQRVVVDRHEEVLQPPQQRLEHPRAERDLARLDGAVRGEQFHARAGVLHGADRRALVDAHAQGEAGLAEPPGQPGGIEHGAAVALPLAADVRGRVHLRPDLLLVEDVEADTQLAGDLDVLVHRLQLPGLGGHVQLAGALVAAVDVVPGDGLADLVEVRDPQSLQRGDLFGPALQPVGDPVGERGHREAAVAAGRRPADPASLKQDHVERRITFLRHQGGPEPREASADHREIGGRVSEEPRQRLRFRRTVEPVRLALRISKSLQRIHKSHFPT